jgi:hypothetical protein
LILLASGPVPSTAKIIPFPHVEEPSREVQHCLFVPPLPPLSNSKVPNPTAVAADWIPVEPERQAPRRFSTTA